MFPDMTRLFRRASLWATIMTLVASVMFYIPSVYAERSHAASTSMPLGYRVMSDLGGTALAPGLFIAYGAVWIWGRMEGARLALLSRYQVARGLHITGGEVIAFHFSAWWLLPLDWSFYLALFLIVVRLVHLKRARTS
jgi:hypothetical protein